MPVRRERRHRGQGEHQGEAAGFEGRSCQFEEVRPGEEGPAEDEISSGGVRRAAVFRTGVECPGTREFEGGKGAGEEGGAFFPGFHHIIVTLLPEHAQRDAGKSGSCAQIQTARGRRQGRRFKNAAR